MFLHMMTLRGATLPRWPAPTPLDEATPSKEEKAKEEKPEEKKAVTVAAGTPMMIKTATKVSSSDAAGWRFSATLEANLLSGDDVVAKAGTQVYGQVIGSKKVGRGRFERS